MRSTNPTSALAADPPPPHQPPPPTHTPSPLAVLADLKRGLPTGALLELPPGAGWRQATHAVLLRGSLAAEAAPELPPLSPRASQHHHRRSHSTEAAFGPAPAGDSAAPSVAGGPPSLRRSSVTAEAEAAWEAGLLATAAGAAAPRVLPWLCSPRLRCNAGCPAGRLPADKAWVAGADGALLLVCLTEGGEVPEGVLEAERAAAHAAAAAAALRKAASEEQLLRSHPLDLGGAPGSGPGSDRLPVTAAAVAAEAASQAATEPEGRLAGLRWALLGRVGRRWLGD